MKELVDEKPAVKERPKTAMEIALDKGYLQDKIVYLRIIDRPGKFVSEQQGGKTHVGYGMWEGATKTFVLPLDRTTGGLVNPFTSEEERTFFETMLKLDLNPYQRGNVVWQNQIKVRVTKDTDFVTMQERGIRFNLADPMDNLRWRVLKAYSKNEIAVNEEEAAAYPHTKFVIVDEGYKQKTKADEMTQMMEVYKFFGSIEHSLPKMKEFLSVYHLHKKQTKLVPDDATIESLKAEFDTLIKEDRAGIIEVKENPDWQWELFLYKATKTGAIVKEGINKFTIPGENTKNTMKEMIDYLKTLKDTTDDTYLKIEASIKNYRG